MLSFRRSSIQSLRVRLTAWYLFLFGCSVFFRNFYIYSEVRTSLLTRLDSTATVAASEIRYNSLDRDGNLKTDKGSRDFLRSLNRIGYSFRVLANDGGIRYEDGDFIGFPPRQPFVEGYRTAPCNGGFCRVYTRKLTGRGWLQVGRNLDALSRPSEELLFSLWGSSILVLLLAGIGGLFVIDRTLRPLDRVIRTAEAIRPDDISQRVRYRGRKDEIGRLAGAIDRMLDRVQWGFEREKRFSANVSHELRTPLTAIKGRIGVTLIRARDRGEYADALREIEGEVDRLIRLTNGLLYIARLEREPLETREIDLGELLEILVEQLRTGIEDEGKSIATEIRAPLPIAGHEDYLISLFLNLLDNAIKYTPDGGKIYLSAFREGDRVRVVVSNPGEGIATEALPHLFERFYRVENARSRRTGGAGLGLAIVQEIVRLHEGSIEVESQPYRLTTFTVTLPARRD